MKQSKKKQQRIRSIQVCSHPRYYKVWRWKYDESRKLQSSIASSVLA